MCRLCCPRPGTVIKYHVAINATQRRLLEPQRDTRTLAHALLGADAWIFVAFDSLPSSDDAEAEADGAARRAQQRVLEDGIVVGGRRFVFFGHKEGRKVHDTRAYFVAERGDLKDPHALYEIPPPTGASALRWRGAEEARGLLAAYATMTSIAKLTKRLSLPFSGAQPGLRGWRCRSRSARRLEAVAAAAPRRVPLLGCDVREAGAGRVC